MTLSLVGRKQITQVKLPFFWSEVGLLESIAMRHRNQHGVEMIWRTQKPEEHLGLPNLFDLDVWTEIQKIQSNASHADQMLVSNFFGYEESYLNLGSPCTLLKKLGKPTDGKWQKHLRRSVERLTIAGWYSVASGHSSSVVQIISGIMWSDTSIGIKPYNNDSDFRWEFVKATPEELSSWTIEPPRSAKKNKKNK